MEYLSKLSNAMNSRIRDQPRNLNVWLVFWAKFMNETGGVDSQDGLAMETFITTDWN